MLQLGGHISESNFIACMATAANTSGLKKHRSKKSDGITTQLWEIPTLALND